ncbi:Sorbitol operon regulator [Pirellulimonas nuda]|uniref:Sorbitol operon regulator n=1 Tax=Pirellulimonas nuda TaxID=2528009 RepID=A0A518D7M7_9BACT|nr:sugar-binding domain-containing protein [Pirellulimonas nuda]QDU87471.1 Sorbitol operon regulator [Pirellulimonas nuda]
MDRSTESSNDRTRAALTACELYYGKNLPQKEVARQLGVSPATVSRLLQSARDEGIVRITIHPPQDIALAQQLVERFGPQGVRHASAAGEGQASVGQSAARYFEATVEPGATVVLDGGRTVEQFVDALPSGGVAGLTIIPIATDPPSYSVSAYELMTRLAARFDRAIKQKLPYSLHRQLDPIYEEGRQAARQADFVMLGCGPWASGYTAQEFLYHLGYDPPEVGRRHPQVVGACAYQPLSADGQPVYAPEVHDTMRHALLIEDLRELSEDADRSICLLASGAAKRDTVLGVIAARMCNCLFVDVELARALLDLPPNGGG